MKITIVEDNKSLANQIELVLKKEGYEVHTFYDANTFLENFDKDTAILLLDINLPDMQGTEILELLNKLNVDVKTIFMTSYDDIEYIKKAFELGCEDYIKKPFDVLELLLRIKRISKDLTLGNLTLGPYVFDLDNFLVYYNGKNIKITKKEAELLKIFLSNLGKVVTFDYLNEKVWNFEVTTNTITVAVLRLKKKLSLENLENIREVGYVFHKI